MKRISAVLLTLLIASGAAAAPDEAAEEADYQRYVQRYLDMDEADAQAMGAPSIQALQRQGRQIRRLYIYGEWTGKFTVDVELRPDGQATVEVMAWTNQHLPTKPVGRAAWDALLPGEIGGFRKRHLIRRPPGEPAPPPGPICHGTAYYVAATGPEGIRQNSWSCYHATDPERVGVKDYAEAIIRVTLAAHGCSEPEYITMGLEKCFPWPGRD